MFISCYFFFYILFCYIDKTSALFYIADSSSIKEQTLVASQLHTIY